MREKFILPTERFRHLAVSALDPAWMDAVDRNTAVFVIAQGLLMYLRPSQVRDLFAGVGARFPGAAMVFDCVPRWFSRLTMQGLQQTPHYQLPPMPWGVDRDEIPKLLRRWHPDLTGVTFLDYRAPRGMHRFLSQFVAQMLIYRHEVPSLVHITL